MKSFEDIQKMENELVKDAQKNISKQIIFNIFKLGNKRGLIPRRRIASIKKIFMTYERNYARYF